MPKMKTHRGAAKRFRQTGSGKLMRRKAGKNHILEKKTRKRKRRLRSPDGVADSDTRQVRNQLGL